ncbi:hypothetical protein Barb7_00419 [Bacteroidales bacterium Barb7]|nr:hypothetical protein Barb7_00419 [Bacteroidales bacterium Barb7]
MSRRIKSFRKSYTPPPDGVASRDDILKTLTSIMNGNARKITIDGEEQIHIPSDSERIRAASELLKMIESFN